MSCIYLVLMEVSELYSPCSDVEVSELYSPCSDGG